MKERKIFSAKKLLILIAIIPLCLTFGGLFFNPSMKRDIMSRMHKDMKERHAHCSKLQKPIKKFNEHDFVIGASELDDFLDFLKTEDEDSPYFPIGQNSKFAVHSKIGKGFIWFVLGICLMSLLVVCVLVPCPCWSDAWKRALKEPFKLFKAISDEDSIQDKIHMNKLKNLLEGIFVIKLITFMKKFCILIMICFFVVACYFLMGDNFGEHAKCGIVESMYDVFENKEHAFFEEFGVHSQKRKTFLDIFEEELYNYKGTLEHPEKIKKMDFGSDSRVLKTMLKRFYHDYKKREIMSCSTKGGTFAPFDTLYAHNSKFLSNNIEKDIKHITKLGDHLHRAAVSLVHMKKEEQHFHTFSRALKNFKDHVIHMTDEFMMFYRRSIDKFEKQRERTKQCFYIMLIVVFFYTTQLIFPKRCVRIQVFLSLVCAILLCWNGLKLYSEVMYRSKTCTGLYSIMNDEKAAHQYIGNVRSSHFGAIGGGMYDWIKTCMMKGADF